MELVFADLKHACRTAAARPAFTLLVVTTLALGIGVNSAVFALLDGVLWRALPYRDPARLVFVWQTLPEHNVAELEPTPHDFASWRGLRSFESLALISSDAYTLTGDDDPERVRGARVTASLLPLLGLAPRVGRVFESSEDQDSAAPTVILSDGLWKRRYGGDAAMVGRSILVNGVPTTVVGVMPASALLPGPLAGNDDLWLPARMTPSERVNPVSHNYTVVARLAANVTVAGARAEIETFAVRMAADEPDSHRGLGARIVPFDEQTVRAVKPALLVVAGGVAMLLLVACANASTLLIVRAASRRHETAVRAALGATQARLVSLAVCESLVLAVLGGVAGLALGNWAINLLLPLFSNLLPPAAAIGVDRRVVLFTALLSGILGIAFGLATVTARRGLGFDSREALSALKSSARTATADPSQARIRSALVVAQIAFAVTLMSAAGLMLHSVIRLSRVSPGFEPSHLLTLRLSLAGGSYTEGAARDVFVRQFMERLGAVADIRQAALTSSLPFGGSRGANGVEIQGRPVTPGETIIIDQRHVTPGYFQAMRIPLLRGRMLTATDDARAEPVVVINRTMADRYFPGSRAIDGRVRVTAGPNNAGWSRIVGVVDNVRHISLSRDPVPEMYFPYAQAPLTTFTVVTRTAGDPAAAAPAVREALRAIDPALPVFDVRTMDERIARSYAQTRATMLLLLVTAALAAVLAAIAIYGSIWYAVTQRIPEIGIRLALGATRVSVCAGIFRNAMALTALGVVVGTSAVLGARPLLAGFLFETPATDASTFSAVIGGILAVTTLACIAPAWRAMHVDPVVALRNE